MRHLTQDSVYKLAADHTSSLTGVVLDIELSCGSQLPKFSVQVREFRPKGEGLTHQLRLKTAQEDDKHSLMSQYSAPLGLFIIDDQQWLRDSMEDWADLLVACPGYANETTKEIMPYYRREVIQLVHGYYLTDNVCMP